ncbi:MAG: hypothetical protein ACREP3_07045, partial [Candidatus Binatia bacterium]
QYDYPVSFTFAQKIEHLEVAFWKDFGQKSLCMIENGPRQCNSREWRYDQLAVNFSFSCLL